MTEIKLTLEAPATWLHYLRAMHDETGTSSSPLSQLADQIEEQIEPAIEEPAEFGSVVKARTTLPCTIGTPGLFWVKIQGAWTDDGAGVSRQWRDLDVIEVLRVGVGDNEAAYNNGVSDTVSALVARLQERRDDTFNDWRAAFTEAIKIAEAL